MSVELARSREGGKSKNLAYWLAPSDKIQGLQLAATKGGLVASLQIRTQGDCRMAILFGYFF